MFKFIPFTPKQKKILTWWMPGSKVNDKFGIIADGAVRSGKTLIMSSSFMFWSMSTFNGETFGMAGKTIASFRRNVLVKLKIVLRSRGYHVNEKRSENLLIVTKGNVSNSYYIFGGKDEASQDLVQGLTAAGFFFDEAVLMPETFINQAVARCSVEGSKIWFDCNAGGPYHFFKTEWIDKCEEKNLVRLQFSLDDNPSLSEEVKDRYKKMFSGVFHARYIGGLWVVAEGIIYSMFNNDMVIKKVPCKIIKKWITIDYGQSNATVFLLCGLGEDGKLYILDEYYHSGKESVIQKSPSTYAKEFRKWLFKNGVEGMPVNYDKIYIDPSAKGFMLQLHEEGVNDVRQANNEVNKGIELLSSIIENDLLRVLAHCKNTLTEFGSYSWDPKAQEKRGEDTPIKKYDHCLDALRYLVNGNRIMWQRAVLKGA